MIARLAIPVGVLAALAAAQQDEAPKTQESFRGEHHKLERIELRGARVVDAVRLIAEISGLNVVATGEAGAKPVSLFLQELTAGEAVETMCKVAGLWYQRDEETQTFRVMTTEEFQKDHIIYRKDEIRVFTLQHPNSVTVAISIEDLYGERVMLSLGLDTQELDAMEGLGQGLFGMGGLGGGSALGGYGGYGASTGNGGFGGRSSFGGGSYARSGLHGAGRYSRSVGMGSGRGRGGLGGRSTRRASELESESILAQDEKLTSEQIAELQRRLAEAGESSAELSAEQLRGISRRDATIYVTVNRQHNLIVVRTTDGETMDEIAALVEELDRPTPQVLLEMKILELAVGDTFQSVFDLSLASSNSTVGIADGQPANPLVPSAATSPRNIGGLGNNPLVDSTFVYQYLDENVRARLQLLASDQRLEIVSTPMVLASNNHAARMFVGEERVLTTGVNVETVTPSTGATTSLIEPVTEVRDVGTTLIIIPKINADRTVTLVVSQDSSTVQEDGSSIPVASADGGVTDYPIDTVNTANMQATVVAKDGMTLAIGGLIRIAMVDREDKVPVLGDIPILDLFFKDVYRSRTKTELILLITPRVLFTPSEAKRVSAERMKELSRHPWLEEGDGGKRGTFDGIEGRMGRSIELYNGEKSAEEERR